MKTTHRRQLTDVDDIEKHNLSFKDKTLFWAFDNETKVAVKKKKEHVQNIVGSDPPNVKPIKAFVSMTQPKLDHYYS